MYGVFLTVLVSMLCSTYAENTYLALIPGTVRPGNILRIPVHFLSPVSAETVTAELLTYENESLSVATFQISAGPRTKRGVSPDPLGAETVSGMILTVPGANAVPTTRQVIRTAQSTSTAPTRNIVLDLTAPSGITWGSYRLKIKGAGTINFENQTIINGDPRSIAIFVQTDKAAYKPGDTVQFRVFAVDSTLKPAKSTLNIEIFNPKGDKIYELMGEDNLQPNGIQGSLPLSERPALGNYRIQAQVVGLDSASESQNFEVLEYVLPMFEVSVTIPPFGKTTDTHLKGKVQAKYTFGKPVIGNVLLQVRRRYSSGFYDPIAVQSEFKIDGEAQFSVPMAVIERVTRNLEFETLVVFANVTESATALTEKGEADIHYLKNPYEIEFFPNMPDNFKPGFGAYPVKIRVKERDERPPVAPTEQVKVTATFFTDKPIQGPLPENAVTIPDFSLISPFLLGNTIMTASKTYPLNPDGTVTFDLPIPNNTATFSIKAEFGNENVFKEVSRFRSPNEVFLKIGMGDTSNLKIRDTVSVNFTSNASPSELNYLVLSRGTISAYGTVPFSTGSFQVAISKEMAPSSRLVVYFVNAGGEIVADGLNFIVDDAFENKVTVQFDQTNVQPKTPVNLKVTADVGSLVNVLAVDKSVLLFRQGNDITPQSVKDKLSMFGETPFPTRGWGIIRPWPFAADDAYDVFRTARLEVLTDADLHQFNLWAVPRPEFKQAVGFGGGMSRMAMSADMAGGSGGGQQGPQGQVRTEFPETWLWKSGIVTNGEVTFPANAPDTVTDFVANAYAIHPVSGLGVAPVTSNLTVFLPFFVNLQLPYSVIRGELAVIQANVFNYRNTGAKEYASVRLKFSPEYDIVSVDSAGVETIITDDYVKCIDAKQGGVTPVFYNIRPKAVGVSEISVRATIPPPVNIFDEVVRQLTVKAEGEEKQTNQAVLISMQRPGSQTESRTIKFPTAGLVPDSQKITVSVVGDLFGPSLKNIDDLIKIPDGTGEQNVLNFAPAVFAALYMQRTGRFASNIDLQNNIRIALLKGYQRQLIYQRGDGSFSNFGDADDSGSLWLTSFIVRVLSQVDQLNIVNIDPQVIDRAVRYILDNQNLDGDFANTGKVIHPAMQGGSSSSVNALTAFTLIALYEVQRAEILTEQATITRLNDAAVNAATFLVRNIPSMTTDYEKAISAYALVRNNVNHADFLLNSLESSGNKTSDRDGTYWKNTGSNSLETETTAYVLLTYSVKNDTVKGLPVLQWLVKQRNAYGGFYSSQDTVVGLQALTEFAKLIYSKVVDLTLAIKSKTGGVEKVESMLTLNSANHDVLQFVEFANKVDEVIVQANGSGLALVDINQFYNVKQDEKPPKYILNVTTLEEQANSYTAKVCAAFNIPNSKSNLAIIDVGVVSGFEPWLDQVAVSGNLKRKEEANRRLILYYDEIPSEEVCVYVPARRISAVSGVKPATVVVYSYYNPNERAMKEYLPSNLQSEGVCTTCPNCCSAANTVPLANCGIMP